MVFFILWDDPGPYLERQRHKWVTGIKKRTEKKSSGFMLIEGIQEASTLSRFNFLFVRYFLESNTVTHIPVHPLTALMHVNLQLTMSALCVSECVCVCVCVCVYLTVSMFALFKILLTWLFDQQSNSKSSLLQPAVLMCSYSSTNFQQTKIHSDLNETVDTELRFYKCLANRWENKGRWKCLHEALNPWVQKPVRSWHLFSDKARGCAI